MSLPTLKLWRSRANRLSGTRGSRWPGQTNTSAQPRRLRMEALEERRLLALTAVQIANIVADPGGSAPHNAVPMGAYMYFAATDDDGTGSELWRTNGVSTTRVSDIDGVGEPQNLTVVGSTLFFTAEDSTNGRELWMYDGVTAPTAPVEDIKAGSPSSNPRNLTNVGGTLYFFVDNSSTSVDLWKSDGTPGGTTFVKNFRSANHMVAMNNVAYFAADDGLGEGQELWKYNGTTASIVSASGITGIYSGSSSSYPAYLTPVGSTLYFQADDGVVGMELWTSDGNTATRVKDIFVNDPGNPANDFPWSAPFQFTAMGSYVYFFADDGIHGEELWRTNGTPGGTTLVKDINTHETDAGLPGNDWSFGYYLTVAQDRLYFYADDGSHGGELWTSDGTDAGTYMVQDSRPGALGSEPWMLTPIGSRVLYRANDGTHGDELWISNGDPIDTKMVADLNPGSASSTPNSIAVAANSVFWGANNGTTGQEPWGLAPNVAPSAVAVSPSIVLNGSTAGALVGTLTTTDPDDASHRYTLVSGAGDTHNSYFTIDGNQLKVAQQIDSETPLSIRVRTTDQALESYDQVLSIGVVNTKLTDAYNNYDPPGVLEKQPSGTLVGTLTTENYPGISNPSDSRFHYQLVSGVGSEDNGSFNLVGSQLFTAVTFDALLDQQYSIRIQVSVDDGTGNVFEKQQFVSIINIVEPPVAVDDVFSKAFNQTVFQVGVPDGPGVLANDTSPDPGVTLSAKDASVPAHGTVSLDSNGSFTYTVAGAYIGHDTFTYRTHDNTGGMDSTRAATVLINNKPVANSNTYSVNEDAVGGLTVALAQSVLNNDIDYDGDSVTAVRVFGAGTGPFHGTLNYFNADGTFNYTPYPNYSGEDHFTYAAKDPYSQSTTTAVTINVVAQADAPVAANDQYTRLADAILRVAAPGVLTGDNDADGEALQAFLVTGPSNGRVYGTYNESDPTGNTPDIVNPNGSFVYVPNPGFIGTDTFTYQAKDPTGLTSQATVTILATPPVDQVTVSLPPSLWEGAGDVPQGGLLTIPAPRATDTTVYLTSSLPNKLTVPPTVLIPAGATAAAFDLRVDNDDVTGNSANVTITAAPRGMISNTATTLVRDNEASSFTFSAITTPKLAGEYFAFTVTAKNDQGQTIVSFADPVTLTGTANGSSVPVAILGGSVVFVGGVAPINAAVQAIADHVVLKVDDGRGHVGSSSMFNVVAGAFDHFVVSDVGTTQAVGTPFTINVSAVDLRGYPVTSFNGEVALTGWVDGGNAPRVVISECSDYTPDYVEIQNVSGGMIDTTGWRVVLNDSSAGNINAVTATTWSLPATLSSGQVLYSTDDVADNYFGENIWWGSSTSKGWAMILDNTNQIVDFVAWGYESSDIVAMAPVVPSGQPGVPGNPIAVGSAWAGAGVGYGGTDTASLQRFSDRDSNGAADFHWVSRTKGTLNAGQAASYVNATPVPITPITSGPFSASTWTGNVVVQKAANGMYVRVNDGQGHAGQANTFNATGSVNLVDTVGIYNPTDSWFFLKYQNSAGGADSEFPFGAPGWEPVAGDWNGDGRDTVGLFDRASAQFYLRNANSTGMADVSFGYGVPGSSQVLIMGDWNGDGIDTVGLYRPEASFFELRNTNSQGNSDVAFGLGAPNAGWIPLVGDWNADGIDTVGLYDPTTGMFYLRNSLTTGVADVAFPFGTPNNGWQPLVGDWNGDGTETAGFYQPGAASHFYLRNTLDIGFADISFGFGFAGVLPLVGNWLGPTGQPLLAADGVIDAAAVSITAAELQPLVDAALARWSELAVPQAALDAMRSTQFAIADLGGAQLGLATEGIVYIDATAAGRGWFVDTTPGDDAEFSPTATDAKAVGRADLLTAVAHELGHAAGLEHSALDDSLMNELLPSGVRRTPLSADVDALFSRLGAD